MPREGEDVTPSVSRANQLREQYHCAQDVAGEEESHEEPGEEVDGEGGGGGRYEVGEEETNQGQHHVALPAYLVRQPAQHQGAQQES